MGDLVQREHPQNSGRIWMGSLGQKSAIYLKWCKIGPRLLWRTNRKLHTRFRLVLKSMTLDDLERPKRSYKVLGERWANFSEGDATPRLTLALRYLPPHLRLNRTRSILKSPIAKCNSQTVFNEMKTWAQKSVLDCAQNQQCIKCEVIKVPKVSV